MTRCYWYHEYRDMNMTVPYCEELRTENPHCENECSCKYYISKDDADKLIRKAIESLSAEPKWIPVSERLPNVGQDVLFCDDKFTQEGYLMKDGNWLQFRWSTVHGKRKVTAWMPLPKPYKGGDTE